MTTDRSSVVKCQAVCVSTVYYSCCCDTCNLQNDFTCECC